MWQNYDEFYGYHWQCWTSFSLSALNVPCEWKYRYVCWIKNMLLLHKFILSLPSSLYLFIWCKNYFGLSIFPYFLSTNGSICLSLTATALIVTTWVRTSRLQIAALPCENNVLVLITVHMTTPLEFLTSITRPITPLLKNTAQSALCGKTAVGFF